jgi:hypothetical protein
MTAIREFSQSYYIIDADVVSYVGDNVVAGHELYNNLRWYVGEPILHIGNGHYELSQEGAVPAATIAVPDDVSHKEEAPVLVAKPDAKIPLEDN